MILGDETDKVGGIKAGRNWGISRLGCCVLRARIDPWLSKVGQRLCHHPCRQLKGDRVCCKGGTVHTTGWSKKERRELMTDVDV